MIPYPPVGIAVLAGSLKESVDATVVDLEMLVWAKQDPYINAILEDPETTISQILSNKISEQTLIASERLAALADYKDGDDLGISVMGYEQLACAMLFTQYALNKNSRVILGGQFWSQKSAENITRHFADESLTVVIGDGWDAIKQWHKDPTVIPVNSVRYQEGGVGSGEKISKPAKSPRPTYDTVNWDCYHDYAKSVYGDTRKTRRAHLYVWDKTCPYRCSFCRVSTGSKAKLPSPTEITGSFADLLDIGVSQFNLMTNELNPSLNWMRKLTADLEKNIKTDDIGWFTYLRADDMELEDLQNLRSLGCRLVRYGVETGSQRLSDSMKKDYNIETIGQVLEKASKADIFNHVNFLVGYPGETEEDQQQTLSFIEKNKEFIHSARINPFYLPPGTPMSREPSKYGVKLGSMGKGHWEFSLVDDSKLPVETVSRRIDEITETLKSHGIGFAGVLPFVTLNTLTKYSTRDLAIAEMKKNQAYLWNISEPDKLKALLGGYGNNQSWQDQIFKRGRNYSLEICVD